MNLDAASLKRLQIPLFFLLEQFLQPGMVSIHTPIFRRANGNAAHDLNGIRLEYRLPVFLRQRRQVEWLPIRTVTGFSCRLN
jgi:hypothetical protein